MDPAELALAALAVLLGGILKGAVGAGAPVVAVPILSMFYGVPFAVAVFVVLNLLSNIWQGWQYRMHMVSAKFTIAFAVSGAIGAGIGSVFLVSLPAAILMRVVACVVLVYIVFRLLHPAWQLSGQAASRWVVPAGLAGGVLQGVGGISAPVSITFLNALNLSRESFIITISILFSAMSLVQLPALISFGVMTADRLLFSVFALIPLFGGMPIGAWLARRVPRQTFDRLVLALLAALATKLLFFS